ncbi:MAG: sigma-70 family RNA polymerase sigma factor [Phormidesmis sp.]
MCSKVSSSTGNTQGGDSLAALKQQVVETCKHPRGSAARQKGMTQLVRLIGRRLWHTSDAYYGDALQQTWIYFCRNLCEATTGRAYDPEIASPVTWLNAYLKRRLQDFKIAENKQRRATVSSRSRGDEGDALDPIDRLPAPPDIPPWLEQVGRWAAEDKALAEVHISQHPEVTARLLILKRLPPETPWKVLAQEYKISVGTLSSFYQRQCLTRLRDYGRSQGYL